ncbi:MAG TPA: tetratricopeptide repeat protein [Candidatus Binatia bacterium]|nr:tetratricopeptide repeat protein [Candidatus Binatia bacterium]
MAEAERVKPRSLYVEEAIQAALESRWPDALAINRALVERHGDDDDTCNRIGKALTELGEHQQALDAYSRALQLNPMNLIAQKNVRKLELLLETRQKLAGAKGAIDVDLFAEEPGKSALTTLNPPKSGVVAAVVPGDAVELHIQDGGLQAQTARGVVLGDVDPKIARRLVPLITTGNRYTAAVARVEESQIEIIIREAFQSAENARRSSFPVSRQKRDEFRPYAKDSLLAQRGAGEEEDEEAEEEPASAEPSDELESLDADEDYEETAPLEEIERDEVDEDLRPEDQY